MVFRRLARLLRYRLIIPIVRGYHPPEHSARGVMVGLVCALNPFIGIQMLMVALVWAVQKTIAPKWQFSVVTALAWTWVTNVLTAPFVYYGFLVTGRVMMGEWDTPVDFDAFAVRLSAILEASDNLAAAWHIAVAVTRHWGVPMIVGSIFWSALGGWLGYRWSLRFLQQRRAKRNRFLPGSRKSSSAEALD